MLKKMVCVALLLSVAATIFGQELNATVRINIQKLQTVDPKVFETLEQTLREFLNNQKWSDAYYEPNERINCNILLTIQEERSPTSFKADLAIQASRPVYNSSYETVILNHIDRDVTFIYEQFQPLFYSRNAYNDNLSAVLSFYSFLILGLDGDTFAPLGGEKYFQLAQEVLNTIPSGAASANPGWRALDGDRNRFWIIENMLSPRVRPFRQAMYEYHRQSLDLMASDTNKGRQAMVGALEKVADVNQAYPNSMVIQMFNNNKSQELIEIFKRGTLAEQDRVIQLMTRIDPANISKYRAIK